MIYQNSAADNKGLSFPPRSAVGRGGAGRLSPLSLTYHPFSGPSPAGFAQSPSPVPDALGPQVGWCESLGVEGEWSASPGLVPPRRDGRLLPNPAGAPIPHWDGMGEGRVKMTDIGHRRVARGQAPAVPGPRRPLSQGCQGSERARVVSLRADGGLARTAPSLSSPPKIS